MSTAVSATREDAEEALYAACQPGDLTAMLDICADREFIECEPLMSECVLGGHQVAASWRHIFAGVQRIQIEGSRIQRTQDV